MNRISTNSNHTAQQYFKNDLQLAIDSNQTEKVLEIMKKDGMPNRPLPNGQMPLNYAIRHEKLELVAEMIKQLKLETANKDFQGLTAVDHAMIGENPKMISLIFSSMNMMDKTIDAEAASKSIASRTPQKIAELALFVQETDSIRSGAHFDRLPPPELHMAARSGDLTKVSQLLDPKDPNPFDVHGMTPLHHAVLAGKQDVVQWLLQNGAKADLHTQGTRSLLHLACIGGHADLVSSLISKYKLNPNGSDDQGKRPLHYAIILENPSTARALIEMGANPLLTEGSNPSPLEMMLSLAKVRSALRDPLALSPLQSSIFTGIVASRVAQALYGDYNSILERMQNGGNPPPFFPYLPLALWWCEAVGDFSRFQTALKSSNPSTTLKAYIGYLSINALASIHINQKFILTGETTGARFHTKAGVAFQAWQSYHVGKGALAGLSSCWQNRSLETYRPIRNALIHILTGLAVARDTLNTTNAAIEHHSFLDAWDEHIEFREETFRNLNAYDRVSFINSFYEKYATRGSEPTPPTVPNEFDFDQNFCGGKSTEECILALNPKDVNQAQKILALSGEKTCKAAYKLFSLKYHPDKNRSADKNVFLNIQESARTLGCLKK